MKNRSIWSATAVSVVLLSSAASAQPAMSNFNDIDADGSGYLSYAEAEAVFGSRGAEGLFRNDANQDGFLSVDELIDGGDAVDADGNVVDSDGNVIEDTGVEYEDIDRGHGNDPDGFDDDNPGRGHDRESGQRGGGNDKPGNNGNGRGNGRGGN